MILFALLSQLFAFDPADLPPLKLPSRENIASVTYDTFEHLNCRLLIPQIETESALWSIDSGQSYLKLVSSYDQVTKQWVISSWDRRKEVRVTIGTNILFLISNDRMTRFTRFQLPEEPLNIPEIKSILKPSFQLYVFDREKEGRLRLLVENPFVGTSRSGVWKTTLKLMTDDGSIHVTEVLGKEADVEGALVSISSKAGFLNIPTGRDLPESIIPRRGSNDRQSSSVSFNLSASDSGASDGSVNSSPRSHDTSSGNSHSSRGSSSNSPRILPTQTTSALAHSYDRIGDLSPRRSPRTPRDYQNLIFWRPTVQAGIPAVYYFGRQASRDEEISFINQLVGHLTDEASVKFGRYLGPWDLFVP